jgi:hypothetical protein
MIKITNGKAVIEVTRGAFEGIYKRQGFEPFVSEEAATDGTSDGSPGTELTEDEKFIADVTDKPIAQWGNKELKRYAELKGLDSGLKANELRKVIKQELDGSQQTADDSEEGTNDDD